MAAIPADVKTEMGRVDSLRRWIRKASKCRAPAELVSAAALSFPGNYARALDGQGRLFSQYDNGPESVGATEGRVVVFAADKMLRVLGESEWWFGDGNFKMAPAIFAQLYVFRTPLGRSAVTCAYALLTRKTEKAYEAALRGIVNRRIDLRGGSPTHLHQPGLRAGDV